MEIRAAEERLFHSKLARNGQTEAKKEKFLNGGKCSVKGTLGRFCLSLK